MILHQRNSDGQHPSRTQADVWSSSGKGRRLSFGAIRGERDVSSASVNCSRMQCRMGSTMLFPGAERPGGVSASRAIIAETSGAACPCRFAEEAHDAHV